MKFFYYRSKSTLVNLARMVRALDRQLPLMQSNCKNVLPDNPYKPRYEDAFDATLAAKENLETAIENLQQIERFVRKKKS